MFTSENLSVIVAILALVFTSVLLARQARQIEHERNALAILEAIERLTDERVMATFDRLQDVNVRYPDDEDIRRYFHGSEDERDFFTVGQFIETIATLSRRGVLDPSLLVDAAGLHLRTRWASIAEFVRRRRIVDGNPYIFENFEWLAMYSTWWKGTPRPRFNKNYDPKQFAGITFKV